MGPDAAVLLVGLDWPSGGPSPVPVVLAVGVLLLAGLIAVERARAAAGRPVLLDLTLFRIPNFRHGNLASSLINVGELGLLFVLPLFLLGVHGTSPLQISVAILPLAIGAFLTGGYAGRLANKRGAHRVVQIGMVLEVAAVVAIGLTITATTTGFGLAPWMLLYGLGLGLTSAQLTNVSLADVPPAQAGQASGTQSTARQVGAALGIALIGTVFATGLGHAMTDRLMRHRAALRPGRPPSRTSCGRAPGPTAASCTAPRDRRRGAGGRREPCGRHPARRADHRRDPGARAGDVAAAAPLSARPGPGRHPGTHAGVRPRPRAHAHAHARPVIAIGENRRRSPLSSQEKNR